MTFYVNYNVLYASRVQEQRGMIIKADNEVQAYYLAERQLCARPEILYFKIKEII